LTPAPQSIPVQPIREVAALPLNSLAERMLHLHGRILSDSVREELRFADASGSIRIRRAPTAALAIGEVVDLFGFAELDGGELKITDARLAQANPQSQPADSDRIITSVAEVHALSPEKAASAIPVHVRATVTYINPTTNTFFVQDQTGPTYVYAARIREFKVQAGDVVDLSGFTTPGQFAPSVSGVWAERVSSSSMP